MLNFVPVELVGKELFVVETLLFEETNRIVVSVGHYEFALLLLTVFFEFVH